MDMSGSDIQDSDFQRLRHLPALKQVKLRVDSLSDSVFAELSQVARLRHLILEGGSLTEHQMRHLAQLQQLDQLDLARTHISPAGLRHLAKSPRLKWLSLESTRLDDEGYDALGKLVGLSSLDLIDEQLTRGRAENLAKLGVRNLMLRNLSSTENHVFALLSYLMPHTMIHHRPLPDPFSAEAPDWLATAVEELGDLSQALDQLAVRIERDSDGNIIELNLQGICLTRRGAHYLGQIRTLRHLTLEGSSGLDPILAELKNLDQLESLNLLYGPISNQGLFYLKSLPRLRALRLPTFSDFNSIGEFRISSNLGYSPWYQAPYLDRPHDLVILPSLYPVYVSRETDLSSRSPDALTDEGLLHLATLPNLETIRLPQQWTLIAVDFVFDDLPNVRTLDLSGQRVSGQMLINLQAVDSLKVLQLSGSEIFPQDVDLLASLTQLESLDLRQVRLNSEWIDTLSRMSHLRSIQLTPTLKKRSPVSGQPIQQLQEIQQIQSMLPMCEIILDEK